MVNNFQKEANKIKGQKSELCKKTESCENINIVMRHCCMLVLFKLLCSAGNILYILYSINTANTILFTTPNFGVNQ